MTKATTTTRTRKAPTKTTRRAPKAAKRTDRGVPFDEMRRLMKIYGSIKCLRKRQSASGSDGEELPTKVDSVKRKFYRWFPDLDSRFEKDDLGMYRPRFGHEFEMRYREEMRVRDGENLAAKRCASRKERHGANSVAGKARKAATVQRQVKARAAASSADNHMGGARSARVTPVCVPHAPIVSPAGARCTLQPRPTEISLNFNQDPMASASIAANTEPVDRSFIAQEGIFDDVESSFFGGPPPSMPTPMRPTIQDCPAITWSSESCGDSSGSEEPPSQRGESFSSLDDVLDRSIEESIEECCEEMLGSDDNDSVSGYLFDMIHSS